MVRSRPSRIALKEEPLHNFKTGLGGSRSADPPRTLSTCKEFLLMQKLCQLVGSGKSDQFLEKSVPTFIGAYGPQLLSRPSCMTTEEDLMKSGHAHRDFMKERKLKKCPGQMWQHMSCIPCRHSRKTMCSTFSLYTSTARCIESYSWAIHNGV